MIVLTEKSISLAGPFSKESGGTANHDGPMSDAITHWRSHVLVPNRVVAGGRLVVKVWRRITLYLCCSTFCMATASNFDAQCSNHRVFKQRWVLETWQYNTDNAAQRRRSWKSTASNLLGS